MDAEQRCQEGAEWRRTLGPPAASADTAATKNCAQFRLEAASAKLGHAHASSTPIYTECPESEMLDATSMKGTIYRA